VFSYARDVITYSITPYCMLESGIKKLAFESISTINVADFQSVFEELL